MTNPSVHLAYMSNQPSIHLAWHKIKPSMHHVITNKAKAYDHYKQGRNNANKSCHHPKH